MATDTGGDSITEDVRAAVRHPKHLPALLEIVYMNTSFHNYIHGTFPRLLFSLLDTFFLKRKRLEL